MKLPGVGQSGRIPNSSTTTRSKKADTLRPGNSRDSSQKRFAQASDHCATWRTERIKQDTSGQTRSPEETRYAYKIETAQPPRLFCSVNSRGCRQRFSRASGPSGRCKRPNVERSFTDDNRSGRDSPLLRRFPEDALLDL